ncbi:MAG: OmpA family protein [Verrucomicrobia bacterium]|nr:OmpA family protein [Verrucomicrobiota bacterium]
MHRSKLPYFFLALAAVLALSALVLLLTRSGSRNRPAPQAASVPPPAASDPPPTRLPNIDEPAAPEDPAKTLANLGTGVADADPATLVTNIAMALEAGDFETFARLVGKDVCDANTLGSLKTLAAAHPLKIHQPDGVREVGELELNSRTRWSLRLADAEPGRDHIFLDLRRDEGKWSVDKVMLPPAPAAPIPSAVFADSLGIADAFLQAVLKQDFEFACDFVDPHSVSDAKIAALCILFEEGQYELRHAKPLRAMFHRGDTVGYLANVQTPDAGQTAQFSLTLRQPPARSNWIIAEINLDELLVDYARRVAGGDIYYSPLVKNPQGGDTLALYFEFDEDQVSPRTRRQLEIVAHILRADPGKKITLSGHTDALGTVEYNNGLSGRRATTVRDFLAAAGVASAQIVTLAKGASQPRRPNVTSSGADDPAGRRANRRTEIYLDF